MYFCGIFVLKMISIPTVQITDIIPQRHPFVFVDSLVECDEDSAVTSYLIREDSIFTEDGVFLTAGLIENIAQSCVAKIGYFAKYVNHDKITIGYIGNVHHLIVYRNPEIGETLHTTVIYGENIGGIQLCEAVVRVNDEIIAQSSIKTAQDNSKPIDD